MDQFLIIGYWSLSAVSLLLALAALLLSLRLLHSVASEQSRDSSNPESFKEPMSEFPPSNENSNHSVQNIRGI